MLRGIPTLVVLHGHDDDQASTRAWAQRLLPRGWQVETPQAVGLSWFETGPRGADEATLARSVDQLEAVVARSAGRGPVVVAGFSQGAAMALALGEVPGVEGVVALCPFLAESDDHDPTAGPPVLMLPAADDEVVPAFLGEDAAAALSAAGRAVTLETLPGAHAASEEAASRARTWLEDNWPTQLRLTVGLPVDRVETGSELVSGEAIAELAAAWERIGFDAAYVTDHPAPDDRWLSGGGHHALEPTVSLSVAAAATSTLLLHTHVYVPGYRNPFLAAKALASLDVISGGRLVLGVAAGYLRPEFEALGAEFDDRGAVLDETLSWLPRIWSESGVGGEGRGFSARSVTALPRPLQQPHPPIWVGGNSLRAMRRAVEYGQGWCPFPTPDGLHRATRTAAITDHVDLAARLVRMEELCAEAERPLPTICFSPFALGDYLRDPDALAPMAEEAAQLWDRGVDWLALSVPGLGRSEVVERAEALADALRPSR
ncbi:MAG: TIGR03619 family F420-dependent LLM class oxidoreductase [Actinomycetia bacterium]|nr:TIGR03619 family F420-dependent LLM class oxidoreductase [Actinomycetes bacterium]